MLALGQEADLSLLDGVPGLEIEDGVVQVDERMMTGHEGIFAGGDMVPAERTVTVGVGHGKQAARNIDAWLRGRRVRAPARARARELREAQHLVLRRRADDRRAAASTRSAASPPSRRSRSAWTSPTRCSRRAAACRCGNCFGCDNCYGVCPDNAVLKVDEADGYAFDLDYCKGCGICVTECPCGAIEMVPET